MVCVFHTFLLYTFYCFFLTTGSKLKKETFCNQLAIVRHDTPPIQRSEHSLPPGWFTLRVWSKIYYKKALRLRLICLVHAALKSSP